MALKLDGLAFLRDLRAFKATFHMAVSGNAPDWNELTDDGHGQAVTFDMAAFSQCRKVFGDGGFTDALMQAMIGGDEAFVERCADLLEAVREAVRESGLLGWIVAALMDADRSLNSGTASAFMIDSDFTPNDDYDALDDDEADAMLNDMLDFSDQIRRLAAHLVLVYGTDAEDDIETARLLLADDDAAGIRRLVDAQARVDQLTDETVGKIYDLFGIDPKACDSQAALTRDGDRRANSEREQDPAYRMPLDERVVIAGGLGDEDLLDMLPSLALDAGKPVEFEDVDRRYLYDAQKAATSLQAIFDSDDPDEDFENGLIDDDDIDPDSIWANRAYVWHRVESMFGPMIAVSMDNAVLDDDEDAFSRYLANMQFAVDLVQRVGLPMMPVVLLSAVSGAVDTEDMEGDELRSHMQYCRRLGASLAVVVLEYVEDPALAAPLACALIDANLHECSRLLAPWYGDDDDFDLADADDAGIAEAFEGDDIDAE